MADLAGVNGTRKDFRVVGKPNLPGVLSWSQAIGVAKFGADYVVPGMLHAKFLRSPYANARIKTMDTAKARAIPGVVDIVTWEDDDIKKLSSGGDGGFFMGASQARSSGTKPSFLNCDRYAALASRMSVSGDFPKCCHSAAGFR